MFNNLSDEKLVNAYEKALELNLDVHFIELLKKELEIRNLTIDEQK